METPRQRLPAVIVRLGVVSFFLDVASEMTYPLLPLFLASFAAAPGLAVGLVEGAAEALLHAVTAVAGLTSDRLRRRTPMIRLGYGIAAISKPLLAFTHSVGGVLGLRLLDRLGKGIRTAPRDALVADLTTRANHGAAFGLHRAMDSAGAFSGVLLALLLLQFLPGDYRTIFLITAIPGAIAVLLAFSVREPDDPPPAPKSLRFRDLYALPGDFWRAAGLVWFATLGLTSEAFLVLRARDFGFSDGRAVLLYALFNLGYAALSYPAGRLSDRIGRRRVMAFGFLLQGVTGAALAIDAPWLLWILCPLRGCHMALFKGVAVAWLADRAPDDRRGTALGAFLCGQGVALLLAGAAAGLLWEFASPDAAFLAGGTIGLLAFLAVPFVAPLPRTDSGPRL